MVYRAAELGYTAIAVTDVNSVAGIVRAHVAAKESGMKLCIGSRLRLSDAPDLLAWAESREGYANLCRLLTRGKRRTEKGSCQLQLADLLGGCEGLLAAVVSQGIDPEKKYPPLHGAIAALKDAVGDRLSLTISRLGQGTDQTIERESKKLAKFFDVHLLATNQSHYHEPQRRSLQDVLACVRHGCAIDQAGFRLFANNDRFLKPPEQMHELFADIPHALRRGIEIARRCQFNLSELRYEYPDEVVPPEKTAVEYLTELTWIGAAERYPDGVPAKVRRLIEHELVLIEQLKIVPYFLTVYDLVRFARSRGILCQGRGSAANSAVCYCIGVTSVDPDQVDLLFERFVSAARDEPPDIDIDFEHERREEVIQYVYEKYGRDRAAMTAEVISYRGRSAVRDVGKAMGLGLDAVESIAKRLDWWDRGKLTPEKIREVGLDPDDRAVMHVLNLSGQLLGFPRHLSQHVGGMVMCRRPLCEIVPIENASMADRTVLEWDKDDIEALGLLKVDVLALGMLTCISKAMGMVNGWGNSKYEIRNSNQIRMTNSEFRTSNFSRLLALHTIPQNDPLVYDMICNADTIGVFQIESRAQMSMLPRLKPKNFYDLVIEVAIVRPGPIQGNMVHPYLRRRDGIEKVSYPKPELEKVLGCTLGVPLFQEQAMKVAMVAAGFSAAEADQLRRAMAAWRYNGKIEQFHRKIVDGMIANGYQQAFAEQCFEQIKGFGEYGFPESHAASFALLVYASAWLKCHHPAEFCAAILNSQPMGFYAPAQLVRDAQEHGVDVRAVDVNHSDWDCTLEDSAKNSPAVRLGFRMIKGFQTAWAQHIEQRRKTCGKFESIDHFHEMTELPVTAVAKLAGADAFGSLPKKRRDALWDTLALPAERMPIRDKSQSPAAALPAMQLGEEIRADYGTTGLSLKGHPLALLRDRLKQRGIISATEVWNLRHGSWVGVAGIVLVRQRPGTASGIVFETLEDETGVVNLIIRPHIFDQYRAAARHASLLMAQGNIERQGKVQHIMAMRLFDLSEMLGGCDQPSRDFH